MSQEYKFEGWVALDEKSIDGNLKFQEYEPKKFDETDVDIEIMYCGMCGSDLHTISGGWGKPKYPQVVGHEIVGKAVRVGSEVKHVKVGDIVGVGAQSDSCRECVQCKQNREVYCDLGQTGTYNGIYQRGEGKGDKSYGGYGNYARHPGHFVFKIPDELDPALAAPMLCAGATVFSPLKQYGAGTTAKDVGIIGIGGLGHFGLLFAKALGANVTAISHSESKKDAAMKMGASRFIATHSGGDKDFEPYRRSLDLIICTTNDANMPLSGYISLLRPTGTLILVGVPEKPLPEIGASTLIFSNVHIGGSCIGSPEVIREMFDVAVKEKVTPWVEKRKLEDVNATIQDMRASKQKFRYVLVNEKNGGKL